MVRHLIDCNMFNGINICDMVNDDNKVKVSACRVSDNRTVWAKNVTKTDGPFYCPDTFEEVIVRRCVEKIDHFAYKARQSHVGSAESDLHKVCKNQLCLLLKERYPNGNWEVERESFNADKPGYKKVRPDVSGRINGSGIIIEVQASVLPVNKILDRTNQYSLRGGYILWVIPLEEELGRENFRPRLFERLLHTLYYGRVYYWTRGKGLTLTPVHFSTAERYIEESSWVEEGEDRVAGGYYKPYKRVKSPVYGDEVELIDFVTEHRDGFLHKNDNLSVPACRIFRDNLPVWWD